MDPIEARLRAMVMMIERVYTSYIESRPRQRVYWNT